MGWPQVQVGRLTLQERLGSSEVAASGQEARTLSLDGQESSPPSTVAELRARHLGIVSASGKLVAVTFEEKTTLNGFYRVRNVSGGLTEHAGAVLWSSWSLGLQRLGDAGSAELEATLLGGDRPNDHSLSGTRWHAPPLGHSSYFTGSTGPSPFERSGEDGDLTVYTGVPEVNPRYGCDPTDYHGGAVQLVGDGLLRANDSLANLVDDWEVSNGLVKVAPDATDPALLVVSHYLGSAWEPKTYVLEVNSSALTGSWDHVSVLRNDPERVAIRLVRGVAGGAVSLDVKLQRGSLSAEFLLQRHASATLGIARATTEAATAFTGGIRATSDDTNGARYVIGSARSFTSDLVEGGLEKASTRKLDFFIGAEPEGSSSQVNDEAEALMAQYLGTPAETTKAIAR